jgi:hypothetical protein
VRDDDQVPGGRWKEEGDGRQGGPRTGVNLYPPPCFGGGDLLPQTPTGGAAPRHGGGGGRDVVLLLDGGGGGTHGRGELPRRGGQGGGAGGAHGPCGRKWQVPSEFEQGAWQLVLNDF